MPLAIYMDHHVPRAITNGLRLRGADVLTAHEDGKDEAPDPDLLDRSTELRRVLFTQDRDLLEEAKRRQEKVYPISRRNLWTSIAGVHRDVRS